MCLKSDPSLSADAKAQMAKDDLIELQRFLAAGLMPLGTNLDTGLDEYRNVQTDIDFVLLPGRTFEMGSPASEPNRCVDEGPVHTVSLSPFLIARTEVTQAQYEAVTGSNPSRFRDAESFFRPVEFL